MVSDKLDDRTIRALEWAAWLLHHPEYVVKDSDNLYEDEDGHQTWNSAEAACGCMIGCVSAAALGADAFAAAIGAVNGVVEAHGFRSPTSALKVLGGEGCAQLIEEALCQV